MMAPTLTHMHKSRCNMTQATFLFWDDLERKALDLLNGGGGNYPVDLRQCMAEFLNVSVSARRWPLFALGWL